MSSKHQFHYFFYQLPFISIILFQRLWFFMGAESVARTKWLLWGGGQALCWSEIHLDIHLILSANPREMWFLVRNIFHEDEWLQHLKDTKELKTLHVYFFLSLHSCLSSLVNIIIAIIVTYWGEWFKKKINETPHFFPFKTKYGIGMKKYQSLMVIWHPFHSIEINNNERKLSQRTHNEQDVTERERNETVKGSDGKV